MIASLLARAGLTPAPAARRCGVTTRTIQNWLAGKGKPRQQALAALECAADALADQPPMPLAERIAVLRHIQQTQHTQCCRLEDDLMAARHELAATNRTLNALLAERGRQEAAGRSVDPSQPRVS